MTRLGRRDRERQRSSGWTRRGRVRTSRFHRPHPPGGSKTTGIASSRSSNACPDAAAKRTGHVCGTIERPIPNARHPKHCHWRDPVKSVKPQGRSAAGRGSRKQRGPGSAKRRSGIVPARLAAWWDSATRLTSAEGDQTSGEVPAPAKKARIGPVMTGLPAVPASADCFGASGRSRATRRRGAGEEA